jgi:hypothetical protein
MFKILQDSWIVSFNNELKCRVWIQEALVARQWIMGAVKVNTVFPEVDWY